MGLKSNATNPKKNLLKCERKHIYPSNWDNISPTSDVPGNRPGLPFQKSKSYLLGPGRVFGRYHLIIATYLSLQEIQQEEPRKGCKIKPVVNSEKNYQSQLDNRISRPLVNKLRFGPTSLMLGCEGCFPTWFPFFFRQFETPLLRTEHKIPFKTTTTKLPGCP